MFNYSTINTFEKEQSSAEKAINKYIASVREELDLDKLITQEEFRLESANRSLKGAPATKSEVEKIYDEFLTVRGRK